MKQLPPTSRALARTERWLARRLGMKPAMACGGGLENTRFFTFVFKFDYLFYFINLIVKKKPSRMGKSITSTTRKIAVLCESH